MRKRWTTPRKAAVVMVAASMLMVTACSSSTGAEEAATTEASATTETDSGDTVLKVGYIKEPSSFDPADFTTVASLYAGYDCYDTLLNFTADGTDVEPALADEWNQVDELTYTYHIREGVKFSDGNDLTMEDVLYSLERVTDQGYYMSYLFAPVDSFEVDEESRTLTVHLQYADSTWKYVPATSPFCILEKSVAEETGDRYGASADTTAGTGPYKLVSWSSGSEIVMEKNEYWWGDPDTLDIDTIDFYIIADESSLAMAAKSGQVDFVQGFSNDVKSIYDGISDMNVISNDGTTAYYLCFDTTKEPFNDVNARKAVASCLNISEITAVVGGSFASESAVGVIPTSMQYMDETKWSETISSAATYVQDYDKAAEYLADSAYPDGFEFDYYYSANTQKLAELIKSEVDASGSITVNLVEVPSSDFFSYMYGYVTEDDGSKCYDAGAIYWMSDFLDPIGFFNPLYASSNVGEGGTNMAGYENATVDELLSAASTAASDEEKMDYYTQAYNIFADEIPYVGLYCLQDSYAIRGTFSFTPSAMLWYNFTYANIHTN